MQATRYFLSVGAVSVVFLLLLGWNLVLSAPLLADEITTVDRGVGPGDVGRFNTLALVDGQPAISYYDAANDDLKYARFDSTRMCATELFLPLIHD